MKKAFFTLIFGIIAIAAFAQEQAIYSQYQVFPILVNPGYTGFQDQHEFVGNARSTWTGFPGKPNDYTIMYSGPVGDKLALGGGLFSEKIGDVTTLKFQLNYAFRFRIQKARIGIGLSTEFLNRSADPSLLTNPLVDKNDDVLEGLTEGQKIFDASVGTHVLYDERLFISLALPNTIRTRLDDVPVVNTNPENNGSLFQHYIFQLGYIADIQSQNFKLIPSLTIRQIRDTPFQIDVNLQGRFMDDKLIAGLTYRPSAEGSAVFLIGTKLNKFQLYYSYDVSFSNFQQYNGGSHEVSVAYMLPRKAPKAAPDPADLYQ
ncbi:MAG: PorP/SprF family type IX secretion system membrane protein [Lewinellaceae bacterium]|nr:PorP/SprF family type IX secretion system membrane protein [Lewinellaceae bacterium]MCB9353075.1 PorP/SprF family type IX secretion system membrane protein [Lewinellaceae bacterium]